MQYLSRAGTSQCLPPFMIATVGCYTHWQISSSRGRSAGEWVSRVSLCSTPVVRSDALGRGTSSQDGGPTAHIQVQEVIWILRLEMRWSVAAVWQSSSASQEHSIKEKEKKNLHVFSRAEGPLSDQHWQTGIDLEVIVPKIHNSESWKLPACS